MAKAERKFGSIPDWATKGDIDGKNYSYRAEFHCYNLSETRKGEHPTVRRGMIEFMEWWEYFVWLGQIPAAFQVLIDEPHSQREFTVPEAAPQWFDTRFTPTAGWRPPLEPWEQQSPQERAEVLRKLWTVLTKAGFQPKHYQIGEAAE